MVKELSNQQETDEKHTNGQAVDIDAGGRPPIVELNPPSFTDPLEEDDDSTKLESILPPITPEILEEYRKEVALREAAKENGWRNQHKSLLACCGVPSFLMLVLILLVIMVIVGTIVAVVFYDPNDGVLPPSDAPSMAPSTEQS